MTHPSQSGRIYAPDGWVHVACPTCGHVDQIPSWRLNEEIYCVHNGRIVWGFGPSEGWTRVVRAEVRAR